MDSRFYVLLFLGLLLGPGKIIIAYDIGKSIVYQDDSDDSSGGGCSACCCLFELGIFGIIYAFILTSPIWVSLLVYLSIFLCVVGVFVWIGRDAKKQNLKYSYLWALLVIISGPVGFLLYFLITRNMKKKKEEK